MLTHAHVAKVLRHLRRMGAAPADAEDLAQQVVMAAWEKRGELVTDDLGAWLYGTAKNMYRNHRRGARRSAASHESQHAMADVDQTIAALDVADALAVHNAVRALPESQQDVVLLHELEGYSVSETSAMLGVAANTVKDRLKQARVTLREALGDVDELVGRERRQLHGFSDRAAVVVLAGVASALWATPAQAATAAAAGSFFATRAGAWWGGAMLGVAATTVVAVVVAPRVWRAEPRITQAASVSPNMWLVVPSPTPMATPTPIPALAPEPTVLATLPRPPAISTAAPISPTQAAARVDREVQLIEQARNAVRQQRPRDGLLAAMQYHRLFPNGQLAQEADLLVIEAYVALNDHALAQRTIATFRARYPASPHLARVEAVGLRLRAGAN